MRVGILDVLQLPARHPATAIYRLLLTKQTAAITPQVVSVWCRRLGHETFYAAYYGLGDAHRLLPRDLDVVFISCSTHTSPVAYALAKLHRGNGTTTVIGGPHAKAFPTDCLRFFDLAVTECDEDLVADILAGHFDLGSVVSSDQPFADVPPVEERMPEIRASAYYRGRIKPPMTVVPMLSSMGCPYRCGFCTDWDRPYRTLSSERLAADLDYVAEHLPGAVIGFHDPNFAVSFDKVFEVLEARPAKARVPYMMECTLSVLRGTRIERLKQTKCMFVAPGVESWSGYAGKAGVADRDGAAKVDQVAKHFAQLFESVPNIQANFILGLDADTGSAPIDMSKRFMDLTPFVWSSFNVPMPFGGTPMRRELVAAGRVLTAMPFGLYHAPYLAMTLKNYDSVTFYEHLVDLLSHSISQPMMRRRMRHAPSWSVRTAHAIRTAAVRARIKRCREILDTLRTDSGVRAFHEGRRDVLPEYYHREYEGLVGRYAELLSRSDRLPTTGAKGAAVRDSAL